ncbi:MAG TPA: TadE/TadG family type IV pilus assembly protein [Candidatus Limnocylindria bacterium]|nr:TadE/TadG family type IV pilus assembly protein [Candidatus Limnocylindria bacterium]
MNRDEHGQSLIELALVLPILVIVLAGMFDAVRAVQISSSLNAAVREGTRFAVVRGQFSATPVGPGTGTYTAPDRDSAVEASVLERTAGIPRAVTVRATWPDGNNAKGSRVVVTATTDYVPVLSAVFIGDRLRLPLSASSSLTISN